MYIHAITVQLRKHVWIKEENRKSFSAELLIKIKHPLVQCSIHLYQKVIFYMWSNTQQIFANKVLINESISNWLFKRCHYIFNNNLPPL